MRTKKELLQAIDNVVDRALRFETADRGTSDLISYIIQELDPDLYAAIRELNNKKYHKGSSHE